MSFTSTDRLCAGFSLSFDASVEELWLAWGTGSTLVVVDKALMQVADEIPDRLQVSVSTIICFANTKTQEFNINVFSTVPSLLAVMPCDERVDDLRVVIVGGEACSPAVVNTWAKNRRMLNTYGPTEAAVVSTYTVVEPDVPVTIGKALPGYHTLVCDPESTVPVETNQEGELWVGGNAISLKGYIGREDLNTTKFLDVNGMRYYRTGDLVREDNTGNIWFLGRIDTQVKIRGYRVELEEIESCMVQHLPQCKFAVVAVIGKEVQQLIAYVGTHDDAPDFDVSAATATIKTHLAAYMVPARFFHLPYDSLPRLTSGKINRKQLPDPNTCVAFKQHAPSPLSLDLKTPPMHDQPLSPFGESLLTMMRSVLGHDESTFQRSSDFFDLGGNSLAAAQVVSKMRTAAGSAGDTEVELRIRDVYEHRTVEKILECLDQRSQSASPSSDTDLRASPKDVIVDMGSLPEKLGAQRFWLVAALQSIVVLVALTVGFTLGLLSLYGISVLIDSPPALSRAGTITMYALLAGVGLEVLTALVVLSATILKWLFVGRFRSQRVRIWSLAYFTLWSKQLVLKFHSKAVGIFLGTPLAAPLYRLVGAKIGKNVILHVPLYEPDLVTIGDDVSIASGARLQCLSANTDQEIMLKPIVIGSGVYIGENAVIQGGARIGRGAVVHPMTLVEADADIKPGTVVAGSPMTSVKPSKLSDILNQHKKAAANAQPSCCWSFLTAIHWCFAFKVLLLKPVIMSIPFLFLITVVGIPSSGSHVESMLSLFKLVPISIVMFPVLSVSELLIFKWLCVGRVRAGIFSLNSSTNVRRWIAKQLITGFVTDSGRPFMETMLLPCIYRLLGVKVGKGVEISNGTGFQPDLLYLEDHSMIADAPVLGECVVAFGQVSMGVVSIGERAFVGNGAVVPTTTGPLGADSLIGVASLAPEVVPTGSSWLGTPPIELHAREVIEGDDKLTYNPTCLLVFQRWMWNFVKILLPQTTVQLIGLSSLTAVAFVWEQFHDQLPLFFACMPAIVLLTYLAFLLSCVAVKWLLCGRFKPGMHPLWSSFIWRLETSFGELKPFHYL